MKKNVIIYTDGACSGNPGPGGWAAYMIYGSHTKIISGGEENTTNNKMELRAPIEALKCLKDSCRINLYSDSKYVVQGITEWINKWRKNEWMLNAKEPVKNANLWLELLEETKRHEINWYWVKGHDNTEGNIIADKAARDEVEKLKRQVVK